MPYSAKGLLQDLCKTHIRHFIVPILLLLLLTISCDEKELQQKEIIWFENPLEETIAADNYTPVKIRAIIPANADVSRRSIKFTTDIGKFSNELAEITLTADADGYADAYIHSNTQGHATITAAILTYSINKKINFTPIDAAQKIHFDNFIADPVVADNVAERLVKVVIDKNTPIPNRKVTFSTDLGTFTNQTATIDIIADKDGNAQTYIKADAPGKAKIKAVCNSFETEAFLSFVAPNPDDIVNFMDAAPASATADGVSTIEIKVRTQTGIPVALRKVAFTTDLGSFPNGTKTEEVIPDQTGVARIVLKSNQEGPAFVTISHRNISRNRSVNFLHALPDNITLSSDFSLKAGIINRITVQSLLTRTIGKPGVNFAITYSAVDGNNQPIGILKNATLSNANSQSQVEFSMGNTSYRGPVTIQGMVNEVPGLKGTTTVTIID